MAAKIIGTGSFLPDNIVTNFDLEKIVDTSDEWIRTRTGIAKRRISTGDGTIELAYKAAKKALENANCDAEEMDLTIVATMTPEGYLPNTACEVQDKLGAVNATGIDLSAACSGFVFAYNMGVAYIESGMAKKVLIIGSETMSGILDWNDRSTCVLFGDGAGAVVLAQSKERGFVGAVTGSDGSKKDSLTCKGRTLSNFIKKSSFQHDYLKMDGQEVFRFALSKVPQCIKEVLEKTNTSIEEIKYMVLHQANERIISSVAKRLQLDLDHFPMNLDEYGNTSAASIPILLDELNQAGKLSTGDKIIISGFGGGLTWGATLLIW